ncbi:MAG: metallophosphoesterase [Elusimicrobiota bacterium]
MKNKCCAIIVPLIAVVLLGALTISAPAAEVSASTAPWKFVVLGDSRGVNKGINEAVVKKMIPAIINERPVFVLFTGDLITGGRNKKAMSDALINWRAQFMEPLLSRGIKVYPVRGNHDILEDDMPRSNALWNAVFAGAYALPATGPVEENNMTYSFVWRNAFIAGLDMYRPGLSHQINIQWFETQLAGNTRPFVFVFAHEPAYDAAGITAHKDGMPVNPVQRDRFAKDIINAGGVMYFCGHDHWYDHARVAVEPGKWLHQFTVGTAGAPLRTWGGKYREKSVKGVAHAEKFGYLVVEITGNSATVTMKGLTQSGVYIDLDTFSYTAPRKGQ